MKRHSTIKPGYDCRKQCQHATPGDHGIDGGVWYYAVSDGGFALSLSVLACDFPDTVERPLPEYCQNPRAEALCTHQDDPHGGPCDVLPSGRCRGDMTFLRADAFWRSHGDPRQSEQPEAFWQALEAELAVFRNAVS